MDFQANFNPKDQIHLEKYRSFGRWNDHAEKEIKQRDSLVQVAGISKSQAFNLNECGIGTMTDLANTKVESVPKISQRVFENLIKQSQVQIKSAENESTYYEVRDHSLYKEKNKGLYLLPPRSENDLFFDIEGFTLCAGAYEFWKGCAGVTKVARVYESIVFDVDIWGHIKRSTDVVVVIEAESLWAVLDDAIPFDGKGSCSFG